MQIKIYPDVPSRKEIERVANMLRDGEVIIYPTDTRYAFGCDAMNSRAVEKICQLKGINPDKNHLAIMCDQLSMVSEYAKINNTVFKLLKENLPGPFTFIVPTSSELPKIFKKRKEVGIRIPDNNIVIALVKELGNPILTSSLSLDEEEPEYTQDPDLIHDKYETQVAAVIDGGYGDTEVSTVVNCTSDEPQIVREGKGELML